MASKIKTRQAAQHDLRGLAHTSACLSYSPMTCSSWKCAALPRMLIPSPSFSSPSPPALLWLPCAHHLSTQTSRALRALPVLSHQGQVRSPCPVPLHPIHPPVKAPTTLGFSHSLLHSATSSTRTGAKPESRQPQPSALPGLWQTAAPESVLTGYVDGLYGNRSHGL